jgi:hypothetical protein
MLNKWSAAFDGDLFEITGLIKFTKCRKINWGKNNFFFFFGDKKYVTLSATCGKGFHPKWPFVGWFLNF